jgi:hypothetical protein
MIKAGKVMLNLDLTENADCFPSLDASADRKNTVRQQERG